MPTRLIGKFAKIGKLGGATPIIGDPYQILNPFGIVEVKAGVKAELTRTD